MKKRIVLLIVLMLCLCFAGCGAGNEDAVVEEAVEVEAEAPVQAEVEKEEEVVEEKADITEPVIPAKKEEFKNDIFSFSYNSNNFTVEENEVGVGVYTKLSDNGGHNTLLVFMSQENTEFKNINEQDIPEFKKAICEQVCKGLFEVDEDVKIINESYEDARGYLMELSDGTRCYAKVMSYGEQLYLAVCRLCPYSISVNDEIFDMYVVAKCLVKEDSTEQAVPTSEKPREIPAQNNDKQASASPEVESKSSENETKKEPSQTQPSPTTGQTNALRKAHDYLDMMAFSHNGLIEQLKYEKFTTEEATYAADNCGADWNEQAVKKAKNYLDMMGFSKDGLIDQLIYDGFTREQATYGAESNGL